MCFVNPAKHNCYLMIAFVHVYLFWIDDCAQKFAFQLLHFRVVRQVVISSIPGDHRRVCDVRTPVVEASVWS